MQLTRYVRRVRELRQDVRFPSHLPRFRPDCPSLLYHITLYRYGRFSKSIRPDEVGACQLRALPLLGYHDKTCALCRDVASFLNTDTVLSIVQFFFCSLVCGACKTGTLHPLFTVRAKRSSKMTANGQMAATSPRGMSCFLGGSFYFISCWWTSAVESSHLQRRLPAPCGARAYGHENAGILRL